MDLSFITHIDQQATMALNGSDSLFWDNLMMCVTNTFAWSLVILMIFYVIFKNNDLREGLLIVLAMGLMIFVADRVCSGLVKPFVARWRPTNDPEIMYLMDVVDNYRGGRFGFFSGHACNTFCMATFMACLFKFRPVTITLYFWAVTTTFTRIYLGVHYVGDVLTGWTMGYLIGRLFYYLFNKVMARMRTSKLVSEQFTPSGYKKTDMHNFLAVVFFNYILVLIVSIALGV